MESNPLLAMLKNAANGPPSSQTPAAKTVSPPPSIQAVSIDDLFKSISGGAPPPTVQSPPSAPSAHSNGNLAPSAPAHQARLLGVLGGSTPDGDRRPSSGGPPAATDESHRRASLLNVLKSPPATTAPLGEPVITHPAPEQRDSSPQSSLPRTTPSVHSPPQQAPKSMFDFVSPFDAFDAAKSRPTSGVNTQSQTPVSAGSSSGSGAQRTVTSPPGPVPLSLQRHISPPGPAPSQVRGAFSLQPPKQSSQGSAPPQDTPAPVPQGSHLNKVRSNSPAGKVLADMGRKTSSPPASTKAPRGEDLTLPWLSSKLVKGVDGDGPKALTADAINVDLSKANVDSLVNAPGTVQVTPTTIMKAERAGFNNRRAVGQAPGWLAYTVSRGRIRIIDRKSGARKLIQLRDTGTIIDIAVQPTGLAAVASDGSVSVFRVPSQFDRNDPDCPLLFYLPSISEDAVPPEKSLGSVNQVEWVRRDSATEYNWLAIGGTSGAVIIKPSEWSDDGVEADPRSVLSASTVLKTNGVIVEFCLNATHQALGLLSASGYFCLYSVVNLNRVWHRQLPTAAPQLPVSSVSFCEANILVGRGSNSHFDLVQITVELAVLTTISFNAPPPNSSALNFASAQYDHNRQTLFIAPFSRGSIFAFHYALKNRPPIRGVSESVVSPFDFMAEFPLEPVLTFVVGGTDEVEFIFSTPNGINQATIELPSLGPTAAATARPPKAEKKGKKQQQQQQKEQQQQQQPKAQQQQREHAATPTESRIPATGATVSSSEQNDRSTDESVNKQMPAASVVSGGLTTDDLARALKKSEDKLSNAFRQAMQKEMAAFSSHLEHSQDISASVSDAVNAHIKQLPSIVQTEIKRALPQAVQGEVRSAIGEHAPAAIHQSLQNAGQLIERAIAPIIPRSVAAAVQPAVDRAVTAAIAQSLIPALESATTHVYEQLAADLKTEMCQIRKDLATEQSEALTATNALIRDMNSTISDLQKQVASLSTQVRSSQAPAPAAVSSASSAILSPTSGPSGPAPTHIASSHKAPVTVNAQQLEDAFLNALHQQTVPATLQLVRERAPQTEQLFPAPPAKSPLSQAVLLTLCHRLAVALGEINPHDPIFQTVATWERLVIALIDPHDPAISSYFKRVVGVVAPKLSSIVARLGQMGNDPLIQAHIGVIRGAVEALEYKAQQ